MVRLRKSAIRSLSLELGIELSKNDIVEIVDNLYLFINNKLLFFRLTSDSEWIPSLFFLFENNILPSVTVDMGAVSFIVGGADVMRPGIVAYDDVKKGDLVVVVDEKHAKPLVVGRMLCDSLQLGSITSGKVVSNLHYVGDKIWNKNKSR